jgi:hypothetical protein
MVALLLMDLPNFCTGENIVTVTNVSTRPRSLQSRPYRIETGWPALHLYPFWRAHDWLAVDAREWLAQWSARSVPANCNCRKHWRKHTLENPPRFESADDFFAWSVETHNAVNQSIDTTENPHPTIPLPRARAIWSRIARAGDVVWWTPTPKHTHTPTARRLIITVATGDKMAAVLAVTRPAMERYAARCNADFVALTETTQQWWGLEKFRVHEYAKQYDQTLFLDADVLVRDGSPDLFVFVGSTHVAIRDDFADLPTLAWLYSERRELIQCAAPDLCGSEQYANGLHCFNTGVVYTTKAAANIWAPPKLPIPSTHCAEQFWIEYQIKRGVSDDAVHRLPTAFNCQWWTKSFKRDVGHSHFIHAANAPDKAATLAAWR